MSLTIEEANEEADMSANWCFLDCFRCCVFHVFFPPNWESKPREPGGVESTNLLSGNESHVAN